MTERYFVHFGETFCITKIGEKFVTRHVDSGLAIVPWSILCDMAGMSFGFDTEEVAKERAVFFMDKLGETACKLQFHA